MAVKHPCDILQVTNPDDCCLKHTPIANIVGCPKCREGTSNFTLVASLLAQYFKMSTSCQPVQTAVHQLLQRKGVQVPELFGLTVH